MNIALIIAGGSGQRMQQDIPKQFLNVYDKPIIVYTLEAFQNHKEIDKIAVVCIKGWENILRAYAKQFNIDKLEIICEGGENGQSSIRNGLLAIEKEYSEDDIVLIHDGIRPMVSEKIISDCIETCKEYGTAIVSIPCVEAILESNDKISSNNSIPRDKLMRTQTPQAFILSNILDAHREALEKGITNSVASCTLMVELGRQVHISPGSEKNVKITTTDDIEIFKSLLKSEKDQWLK